MAIMYVKEHGATGSGTGFRPSSWTFGLQDVSAAESGRTEDTIMHKNRVGQKRKISLGWNGLTKEQTGEILRAFNPEYIDVYYEDDMSVQWEWRTFYVGDRSAMRKWWWDGKQIHETVSFDIIEV